MSLEELKQKKTDLNQAIEALLIKFSTETTLYVGKVETTCYPSNDPEKGTAYTVILDIHNPF
jgi:hypothetical protein